MRDLEAVEQHEWKARPSAMLLAVPEWEVFGANAPCRWRQERSGVQVCFGR
jgi:hypothetical protein